MGLALAHRRACGAWAAALRLGAEGTAESRLAILGMRTGAHVAEERTVLGQLAGQKSIFYQPTALRAALGL